VVLNYYLNSCSVLSKKNVLAPRFFLLFSLLDGGSASIGGVIGHPSIETNLPSTLEVESD
jgi:hypothetical protein